MEKKMTDRDKMWRRIFAKILEGQVNCQECGALLSVEEIEHCKEYCFPCYERIDDVVAKHPDEDVFYTKRQWIDSY